MPKTAAQARPADLKRTVRRLLSYMGHAKFSLLAVGVLASVAAIEPRRHLHGAPHRQRFGNGQRGTAR